MAKTKEELNQLKVEYETVTTKLQELTDDELKQVSGGGYPMDNFAGKIKNALGMSCAQALVYFAPFLKAFKEANSDKIFIADQFENVLKNDGIIDSDVFIIFGILVGQLYYFAEANNYPDIAAKLLNVMHSLGK